MENENNFITEAKLVGLNISRSTKIWYLPSRKVPRWIVLENDESFRNLKNIARPTKIISRIYLYLFLNPYMRSIFFWLFDSTGYKKSSRGLNYYTGAKGPYQKNTFQIVDGNNLKYCKLAVGPLAHARIYNEVKYLKILSDYDFCKMSIPQLRGEHFVSGNLVAFEQSHLKSDGKFYSDVDKFLIDALLELAKFTIIKENRTIKCLSHGDFSPWNTNVSLDGKLNVFDWEMAEYRVLGWDLLNYIFHKEILINDSSYSINRIFEDYRDSIEEYFNEVDISLDIDFYIQLYIKDIFEIYNSHITRSNEYKLDFDSGVNKLLKAIKDD